MATSDNLVSRKDLELRFGPRTVALYIDDDGDEEGDSEVMELILQEGSQRAEGLLLKGFTRPQIEKLVDSDAAVRGYILDICADVMSVRRPEHIDSNGEGPYTKRRKAAEIELRAIAKAEDRSRGETDTGTNAIIRSTTNIDPFPLQFTKTRACKTGQGGF